MKKLINNFFKKAALSLMVIPTILLPLSINAANRLAPGKVAVDKTAEIDSGDPSGRTANVKIKVTAEDFIPKTNVVLVIDGSTSMTFGMDGNRNPEKGKARIDIAKRQAKNAVEDILIDGNSDVKMALVLFGRNVTTLSGFTSNKNKLKSEIDAISIDPNTGTNTGGGIQGATVLLDDPAKAGQKNVIILLTDGEPTYFTSDSGNICGDGKHPDLPNYSYECKVKGHNGESLTARKVAQTRADQAKALGIEFYTIAFSEGSALVAEDLKNMATNPEHAFSANSEAQLKAAFKKISSAINIVAKNAVVKDVIPNDLELVEPLPEGVTTETNEAGETVLVWNIGEIDASEDPELNFKVKAKEGVHGSVKTNNGAKLTAKAARGNNAYTGTSGLIEIDIPDPDVPIPSVTVDDQYTRDNGYEVYYGNDLTVDAIKGILANDKLSKPHEDVETFTNRIVLEDGDGNITINNDGSFTFKVPDAEVGPTQYVYHYYIETTVGEGENAKVVKSNISTITIDVLKKTKYHVEHKVSGENGKLLEKEAEKEGFIGDKASGEAKEFEGYTFKSNSGPITLIDGENIITILYDANEVYYDVEYRKDSKEGKELAKAERNKAGKFEETVTENAKDITGYTVDQAVKTITLALNNNKIVFIYTANQYNYVVKYLEKGSNKVLHPEKTVAANYNEEVEEDAENIKGYTVDKAKKSITIDTEGNEIIFYYTINQYDYVVKYLEKGSNKVLHPEKKASGDYNKEVTETAESIKGYTVDENEKSITIDTEGNEIIFYYRADDVPYIIKHVDFETGEEIADSDNGTAKFNSSISVNSKEIEGYEAIDVNREEKLEGTTEEENTFVVNYSKKILDYEIRYVDTELNELLPSKTATAQYKEVITIDEEKIEDIFGYDYIGEEVPFDYVIEDKELNVITLVYDKKKAVYTVKYLEKGSNKELAKPLTVDVLYGDKGKVEAIKIEGYHLVSDKTVEYEIKEDKLEIVFYYEKDIFVPTGVKETNTMIYVLVAIISLGLSYVVLPKKVK